jgi:hypothetical protein
MSHLYTPLKNMYQNVDVYMITHEFEHYKFNEIKKKLLDKCNFFNIHFTTSQASPRLPYTFFNLLRFVDSKKIKYDRYIITRTDLFYKNNILKWMPNFPKNDFCWYLFKDYPESWTKEKKISDIIFIIDNIQYGFNNFMNSIYEFIKKNPLSNDLHGIYNIIEDKLKKNIDCITEGNYDSNSARPIQLSCNPIYIMINRKYYFDENDQLDIKLNNIFTIKNPTILSKKIMGNFYCGKKTEAQIENIKKVNNSAIYTPTKKYTKNTIFNFHRKLNKKN